MESSDMETKPDFRVIVAGGRDFANYELLKSVCDNMLSHKIETHQITIVSGGARGADALAIDYARDPSNNFNLVIMNADWDTHGKSAGYIRNTAMAEFSDALIAFWDSGSRGTKHMIEIAKTKQVLRHVVSYEGTVIPV